MAGISQVTGKIKKVTSAVNPVYAWIAFLMAGAGSFLLSGSVIGQALADCADKMDAPWRYIPAALLIVAMLTIALDILKDLVPNGLAFSAALSLPMLASLSAGWVAEKVQAATGWMLDFFGPKVASALGGDASMTDPAKTGMSILLAATLIALACVFAKHGIKGAGGAGSGRSTRTRSA